jgi:sulfite reductase (NADPH) flavoprotein alpha-component
MDESMSEALQPVGFDKNNPFPATVTENRLLTKPGSAKDTRHYVVDLTGSGLTYTCGDSLAVFPKNAPESVVEVLSALRATGDEPVRLPKTEADISLREALCSRLSLAQPSMRTLRVFLERANDAQEISRLEALLAREARAAMKEYLKNREFIDLLLEYRSVYFTPQEFAMILRRLVPRLYSIASSPMLYPEEVHLTVAMVHYVTNERSRIGVCTTYMAERMPLHEAVVPVFVARSHFGLPEDDSTDLIMVGPGTGIAPFRAFFQERVARGARGRMWIFFGDQHAKTDYLYGEEFEQYLIDGSLTRIDLAWSRDQDYKIYVQDKMKESGAELWRWLDAGAYFYVCGDAQYMAPDVDRALCQIAEEHGGLSEQEAIEYIKGMKKTKRYQRDVY